MLPQNLFNFLVKENLYIFFEELAFGNCIGSNLIPKLIYAPKIAPQICFNLYIHMPFTKVIILLLYRVPFKVLIPRKRVRNYIEFFMQTETHLYNQLLASK